MKDSNAKAKETARSEEMTDFSDLFLDIDVNRTIDISPWELPDPKAFWPYKNSPPK